MTKYLLGHTSMSTAYEVGDYPYGFKLRCKKRYWLEQKIGKKGMSFPQYRLCTQTTNPKKEGDFWNAIKKSTFSDIAAVMYLEPQDNGEDHVKWDSWTHYSDSMETQAFMEKHKEGLTEEMLHDLQIMVQMKERQEDR